MNNNDKVKSSSSLRSLMDDLDHYTDTFMNAFIPNSGDVAAIRAWLKASFDDEIIDRLKLSSSNAECREKVNVMGVGCGDGAMDEIIIGKFRRRFGKVRYTAVEPGNVIGKFRLRAKDVAELADVEFTWRNTTYDDFSRGIEDAEVKFDFVSLIHSAYYMEDLTTSLNKLMDSLNEGGALLIITNTDDNALVRFLNHLSWKESNTQARLTDTVQDFVQAAELRTKTFDIPAKINVTSCFDPASEVGNKLLDFLTETAHFRNTAPRAILEETLEVMTSLATVDKEDGKICFDTNCEAMLIFK